MASKTIKASDFRAGRTAKSYLWVGFENSPRAWFFWLREHSKRPGSNNTVPDDKFLILENYVQDGVLEIQRCVFKRQISSMCVIQRPRKLPFYDCIRVERLCFSCAALFDKPCPPATARKLEDHVFVLSGFIHLRLFFMNTEGFQSALNTLFSEPHSHVILKIEGQCDPQKMASLSTNWWQQLFLGLFLDCWVDDFGVGFVHFRDPSFGTRVLPAKKLAKVKSTFAKALYSESQTWELRACDSLRAAHIYMGMARP
jgi:hypothetical protein